MKESCPLSLTGIIGVLLVNTNFEKEVYKIMSNYSTNFNKWNIFIVSGIIISCWRTQLISVSLFFKILK